MSRSLTNRRFPRWLSLVLSAMLAMYWVPTLAIGPAGAADGSLVGGFEIDGNATTASSVDWDSLEPSSPGLATGVDNVTESGQDTTTFQGSSKEFDYDKQGAWPSWKYGDGNASGKSDFGRWATYSFLGEVAGQPHVYLALAFDRGSAEGTGKYVFELNQIRSQSATNPNPSRSQGDVRLVMWDQGNGLITMTSDSDNPDAGVWVWDDPDVAGTGAAGEDADQDGRWIRLGTGGVFAGATNKTESVAVPSWWTGLNVASGAVGADRFVEIGVDLTSFGAVVGCPSGGFAAANARSITGTGGPGTLVDYLSALPIDIPSACSALEIVKGDSKDHDSRVPGATFTVDPDPRPGHSGVLTVIDGGQNDPDGLANGMIRFEPAVPRNYAVTETVPPDGWLPPKSPTQTVEAAAYSTGRASFYDSRGTLTFTKEYEGGLPDASDGATFLLTRIKRWATDAGTATLVSIPVADRLTRHVTDNGTGDADGTVGAIGVGDLETGLWSLAESAAPTGFRVDPSTRYFVIGPNSGDSQAAFTALDGAPTQQSSPTFIDSQQTYALTLHKLDAATNEPLAGATFGLWEDTNGSAGIQTVGTGLTPADISHGSCTSDSSGNCTLTGLAWGPSHQYYWVEAAVPTGYSILPAPIGPVTIGSDGTTSGARTAVENPRPRLVTDASHDPDSSPSSPADAPARLPSASISDTATISWLLPADSSAESIDDYGRVDFSLYGPFTPDDTPACDASHQASAYDGSNAAATVSVNSGYATITATSALFIATRPGIYYWLASYSGDNHGNPPVTGTCGDSNESSVVLPAQPGLSTSASASTVISVDGTTLLQDTAFIGNGFATPATWGTVDFQLYRVVDLASVSCAQDGIPDGTYVGGVPGVAIADVEGVPTAAMAIGMGVTVSSADHYQWIARYSGDQANAETGWVGCGDPAEQVSVGERPTWLVTSATPQGSGVAVTVEVPVILGDTATVYGTTADAGGTVEFALYGPFADETQISCVGQPVDVVTKDLIGGASDHGVQVSASISATAPGWYGWFARYSGDAKNLPSADSCASEAEHVRLVGLPVPGVTKTAVPPSGSVVPRGQLITYTVVVSNMGNVPITDSPVVDTLPAGVTYTNGSAAVTPAGGASTASPQPLLDAQQLVWTVDLPAGSSLTITYDVTVDTGTCSCQQLVNTAVFENLEASTTHTVGVPEPSLTKVADPPDGSTVQPGQPITYTVTVHNAGNYPVTDDVLDNLPLYVTYTSVASDTPIPTYDHTDNTLTWSAVTLAAGATKTFVYTATVDANVPTGGTLTNIAHFEQLSASTSHHTGTPGPGLDKTATPASGATVHRGDLISFTVTVGNTGDYPVSGPVLDTLPADVTLVTGSITGGGVASIDGKSITWNANLGPKGAATYTYQVRVDGNAPGGTALVNTASFQQLEKKTTHTVVVPVTPPPPTPSTPTLSVAKSVDKPVAQFGDTLTYALTAKVGPAAGVSSTTVTDVVPAGTTYVEKSALCDPGTCTVSYDESTRTLTWALGDLAAGATRTVSFKVTIDTPVTAVDGSIPAVRILNVGAIESAQTPKAPSNEVRTDVVAVEGVKIAKPPTAPTVPTGGSVLPRTGPGVPLLPLTGAAVLLIGLGVALTAAVRRREH